MCVTREVPPKTKTRTSKISSASCANLRLKAAGRLSPITSTTKAARQFDVLLFWSLDRLSREGVLPTLQHLQRLTSYGVGSYTEQYFDSWGRFRDAVTAVVATVAKQERIRISERGRAGLETARNKGKRLGWPRAAAEPPKDYDDCERLRGPCG